MIGRQVEVVPGAHLVASSGGVLVVVAHRDDVAVHADSPSWSVLAALLELVRESAAKEKRRTGRMFARLATSWLMSLDDAEEGIEFGVVTPADSGLAVFLHGRVTAVLSGPDRTEVLRGRDAGFTVDRVVIPAPGVGVGLFVDEGDSSAAALPERGVFALDAGTAAGSGAVLWFGVGVAAEGEPSRPIVRGADAGAWEVDSGAVGDGGVEQPSERVAPERVATERSWRQPPDAADAVPALRKDARAGRAGVNREGAVSSEADASSGPGSVASGPGAVGFSGAKSGVPSGPGAVVGSGPAVPSRSGSAVPSGPEAAASSELGSAEYSEPPSAGHSEATPAGRSEHVQPARMGQAAGERAQPMEQPQPTERPQPRSVEREQPRERPQPQPTERAQSQLQSTERPHPPASERAHRAAGGGQEQAAAEHAEARDRPGSAPAARKPLVLQKNPPAPPRAPATPVAPNPIVSADVRFAETVPTPPSAAARAAAAIPPDDDTGVVVKGFRCSRHHLNDPRVSFCAVCGIRMDQLTCVLTDGVRPPLGLLLLDDGTSIVLDSDCVLGREPEHAPEVERGAKPIRLEDKSGGMSRAHAEVRLIDWDVTVIDRGSANGTFLKAPGSQEWTRTQPGYPAILTPGAQILLGSRTLTFDSPHGQL